MSLIVEDGTRPPGANVYASVSSADVYFTIRGASGWDSLTIAEKEGALVKATDFLNGLDWKGRKIAPRTMAWPRVDVVDGDGWNIPVDYVPEAVELACCYMAGQYGEKEDPLAPTERSLTSLSVGAISMSWEGGGQKKAGERFPAVKAILKGLLQGGASRRLIKA